MAEPEEFATPSSRAAENENPPDEVRPPPDDQYSTHGIPPLYYRFRATS